MTTLQVQLRDAFDTLKEVRDTRSSNAKIDILKQHTDNEVLKTLLLTTYNSFIQYFIKKIPEVSPDNPDNSVSEDNYAEFLQLLCGFSSRRLTGNAAISALKTFLKGCSEEEIGWYTKVLQRDIKCGVAEKGINKAFKNLIPTYEVMLADKIEAADIGLDTNRALEMLPEYYICESKLDGMRLEIVVPEDDYAYMCSRNGKIISGYSKLLDEAKCKLPHGYVYDGEIMSLAFEKTLSKAIEGNMYECPESDCFNDLMTSAFAHKDNKEGIFNLFDAVPIDEWKSRNPTQTLLERKEFISTLKEIEMDTIKIVDWSTQFCKHSEEDRAKTVDLMKYFISIGYEGLMIKDVTAKYTFKRSKALIKMKLMNTVDLEVLDVYEGKPGSKYVGMLGGVRCDYKGYELGVGSGWSDQERQLFWEHPELIVGKTIEVRYQNESNNQDGGVSARFPIKKSIRYDK